MNKVSEKVILTAISAVEAIIIALIQCKYGSSND